MKIDTVFSGGGVKAYAFIGALESLATNNIKLERVAGTSAGAIIASLIAAGYQVDELKKLLKPLDLNNFLDQPMLSKRIPFMKWIYLYFKMGIYKGDKLEKWLSDQLLQKGIRTFGDLPVGYLKIIISDISLGKLIIIPDDVEKVYGMDPDTFNVAKAVRMSASFPYLFVPKTIKSNKNEKSFMVDGGLLSNFPLWIFDNKALFKRPVLGISLSDSLESNQPTEIKNAVDMLHALFHTMLVAHDARYISKSKEADIVFIPVKDIKATNLKISDDKKTSLIHLGKEKTDDFLKFWP